MSDRPRPVHEMFSRWLIGLILVFSLIGFFGAFNAAQLTSEGTAERILNRAVATLVDIDAILPALEQDLHTAAAESSSNEVQVPDYPVDIQLSRQQALTLSGADLRQALLNASADKAYEDGLSVLASADPEAQRNISLFSSEGVIDRGLRQLTGGLHIFWLVAAVLLGLISLLALVTFVRATPSFSPAIVLGAVLLAAGLPSLAATLGLRFLIGSQGDSDPFVDNLIDVGRDALWVPMRNYIVICAFGAGIILLTLAVNWANREPPRRQPIAS